MHALVREQRYCWDRSALCFYSVALQMALASLTKEKTCHIFSEASLPQQLGDQATVHASEGLPDKGNGTCQRFWANVVLQTPRTLLCLLEDEFVAIKTKTKGKLASAATAHPGLDWETPVSKWCHGNASYSAIRPVWSLKGEPTGIEQGVQMQTHKHLGRTPLTSLIWVRNQTKSEAAL